MNQNHVIIMKVPKTERDKIKISLTKLIQSSVDYLRTGKHLRDINIEEMLNEVLHELHKRKKITQEEIEQIHKKY